MIIGWGVNGTRFGWFARIGLVLIVLVVSAAIGALSGPGPARADVDPGQLSVTFTDLCGFVQADVVSSGPTGFVDIRFERNAVPLNQTGFFNATFPTNRFYAVGADGDTIQLDWDVTGGGTEHASHVHSTPTGCSEPNLSAQLQDSCGSEITFIISNTGVGPADNVYIFAPTISWGPYTVPVGTFTMTVPALQNSTVDIKRMRPGGSDINQDLGEVAFLSRAPGCGIPMPAQSTAWFTPLSCTQLRIVFWDSEFKANFPIYRNGVLALTEVVDSGNLFDWTMSATPGDVITLSSPPVATYTFTPPGCAPPKAPMSKAPPPPPHQVSPALAPPSLSPPPFPSPVPVGPTGPAPTSSAAIPLAPSSAGSPASAGVAAPRRSHVGLAVTATTAGTVTAAGLVIMVLLLRRRRPELATTGLVSEPDGTTIVDLSRAPAVSVRWEPRLDAGPITLWEGP